MKKRFPQLSCGSAPYALHAADFLWCIPPGAFSRGRRDAEGRFVRTRCHPPSSGMKTTVPFQRGRSMRGAIPLHCIVTPHENRWACKRPPLSPQALYSEMA